MRIIRTPEQELKDQLRNLKDLCDSYDSGNEAIKTSKLNPTDSTLPGSFDLPTLIPHSPNITPSPIKRLQPTSHLCKLHSHYLNTHLSECLQRRCHRDLREKIRPDNRFRIAYFSSGHHPVEKKVGKSFSYRKLCLYLHKKEQTCRQL